MASGFNLVANLQIRGPFGIKPLVSRLQSQLNSIRANVNIQVSRNSARDIREVSTSLRRLNINLNDTVASAHNARQALAALAVVFSAFARGATRRATETARAVDGISDSLNRVSGVSRNASVQLSTNTANMARLAKSTKTTNSELEEFGRLAGLALKRFGAFTVATGAVFGFGRAIVGALGEFLKFDTQMTKLVQVTGRARDNLGDLRNEIDRLSRDFGVSSTELAEVAVTLAQAGLSATDTKIALEALARSTLAASFGDINQTTEGSIALMRQFGIGANELSDALGSLNAVSNAFAVESDDIIVAIQKAGGVFAASSDGVSTGTKALNEFMAVFTSVRQTTRESADSIATGLRTIFSRLQRPGTQEALKGFGINLLDDENKFVGQFEAFKRLSDGLSKLDTRDTRFAQITEELGGIRQLGKLIPAIKQNAVAQKAFNVGQEGQQSLLKDSNVALQSLAVQLRQVREEFVSLIRSVGESQTFQIMAKTTLAVAENFITLARAIEPILPFLAVIGTVKVSKSLLEFGGGFLKGLKRSDAQNATQALASGTSSSGPVLGPNISPRVFRHGAGFAPVGIGALQPQQANFRNGPQTTRPDISRLLGVSAFVSNRPGGRIGGSDLVRDQLINQAAVRVPAGKFNASLKDAAFRLQNIAKTENQLALGLNTYLRSVRDGLGHRASLGRAEGALAAVFEREAIVRRASFAAGLTTQPSLAQRVGGRISGGLGRTGRFLKNNAGGLALGGALFGGAAIQSAIGDSTAGRAGVGAGIGGALTGGASGFLLAGPIGAGIGAFIGGIGSMTSAIDDFNKKQVMRELTSAIDDTVNGLRNFGKTNLFNTSDRVNRALNTGTRNNLRDVLPGFSTSIEEDAERVRGATQDIANSILDNISRKASAGRSTSAVTGPAAQLLVAQSTEEGALAFADLSRKLVQIKITQEEYNAELDKLRVKGKAIIDATRKTAEAQFQLTRAVTDATRPIELLAEKFETIAAVAGAAAQAGDNQSLVRQQGAEALSGRAGAINQFGAIFSRISGNFRAFTNDPKEQRFNLDDVGRIAGRVTESGDLFQKQIGGVKQLEDLPFLLQRARGVAQGGGDARGFLTKEIATQFGNNPALATVLQRRIDERFSSNDDDTDLNIIDKLLDSGDLENLGGKFAENVKQATDNIIKSLDVAATNLANGLNKAADLQISATNKFLESAKILTDLDIELDRLSGKPLDITKIGAAQNARISGLAGNNVSFGGRVVSGVLAPGANDLGNRIRGLKDLQADAQTKLSNLQSRGIFEGGEFDAVTKSLLDINVALEKSKIALQDLAENTDKAAAIREKLNDLERIRSGANNVLEALATGSPEDLNKLIRQQVLGAQALRGDASVFGTLQNRKDALAGIQQFQGVAPSPEAAAGLLSSFFSGFAKNAGLKIGDDNPLALGINGRGQTKQEKALQDQLRRAEQGRADAKGVQGGLDLSAADKVFLGITESNKLVLDELKLIRLTLERGLSVPAPREDRNNPRANAQNPNPDRKPQQGQPPKNAQAGINARPELQNTFNKLDADVKVQPITLILNGNNALAQEIARAVEPRLEQLVKDVIQRGWNPLTGEPRGGALA